MDYVTKESNALYKLLCKDPVFKAELNDWAEGIYIENFHCLYLFDS